MLVSVIGLGEVGGATFNDMLESKMAKCHKFEFKLYGVDISLPVLEPMRKKYRGDSRVKGFGKDIIKSDVYIVSVYSNKQVIDVVRKINSLHPKVQDKDKKPLIVIEATVSPTVAQRLTKMCKSCHLVLFPHRFNPNDPEHRVFNLTRVMGGMDSHSLSCAMGFYTHFMSQSRIHITSYETAALSKPMENAYRFIEIAIAEDIRMECGRLGIDFGALRLSMNTKWNIDMKEARDGINGKCLPKDAKFMHDYFSGSGFIEVAHRIDKRYRKWLEE